MKYTLRASAAVEIPKRHVLLLILACSLMQVLPVRAESSKVQEIEGKVERALDGDTLVFLPTAGRRFTIRLAGIDAPERDMPYGNLARQRLIELANVGTVMALATKTDRCGRTIAKISIKGIDLNLVLVQEGLAWHYKQYAHEQAHGDAIAYASAEIDARARHVGIWQDSTPIPPWAYRKCQKSVSDCRAMELK